MKGVWSSVEGGGGMVRLGGWGTPSRFCSTPDGAETFFRMAGFKVHL